MADSPSSSRVFSPPQDRVPDSDPAIVRVPLDEMPWAARKSQQKGWDSGWAGVRNLPNGK